MTGYFLWWFICHACAALVGFESFSVTVSTPKDAIPHSIRASTDIHDVSTERGHEADGVARRTGRGLPRRAWRGERGTSRLRRDAGVVTRTPRRPRPAPAHGERHGGGSDRDGRRGGDQCWLAGLLIGRDHLRPTGLFQEEITSASVGS